MFLIEDVDRSREMTALVVLPTRCVRYVVCRVASPAAWAGVPSVVAEWRQFMTCDG